MGDGSISEKLKVGRMTQKNLISATKANSLYWLGRYEERVYITLHLLRKCYDKMIDEDNIASVMAAQVKAKDNAILLRENIMSETLSYLEMSVALMKECKERHEMNITALQPVIDWSLAFWGSAEQRLRNHKALYIMMIGRNVENLDMLLRFDYPYERVALAYDSLKRYIRQISTIVDDHIEGQLNSLIIEERFNLNDVEYKNKLLKFINQLVRV